jgi:hypothetical protein
MKVLSLQCSHQHAFEGWFGSEDDFQNQLARGLVTCPLCADPAVQKMPSAPRLNFGAVQQAESPSVSARELSLPDTSPAQALKTADEKIDQAVFLKALRQVLANTEDVGERFVHQARAMHYGDIEPRSIRGKASAEQAIELIEEGVDVMPLPASVKETLQ